MTERDYYVGMISGTSRDGVDAALVSFSPGAAQVHSALCAPYPAELADRLKSLISTGHKPTEVQLAQLDIDLAGHFSATVVRLLQQADVPPDRVAAIGSHGQTVWHEPDGNPPVTIQLGDPALIARLTGIVTVGDMRSADVEAGGQGAPLAPLIHRALFSPAHGHGKRVVLNLGGIANISILDQQGSITGFDTGPANCLMDAWMQRHKHEAFDRDGAWAAGAAIDSGLLEDMLEDPYFARKPPKSTGVEYFNLSWLDGFPQCREIPAQNVQATLAEFTAVTVANAIQPHAPADVLICGGGVHNGHLLKLIRSLLSGSKVCSTARAGLDPDWVEAVLLAWLARERLSERTLNTAPITGATHPVLLGSIHQPLR